jgi:hypothetical protein
MRAEAAYQVDQYHLRLLRLKGLAVDCPILHRSDRVVDGRGDQLFPHRQGATRALLAATGMGGGVAWIQMAKSKREALMLEAVKIAVEVGIEVNAANTNGRTRQSRSRQEHTQTE